MKISEQQIKKIVNEEIESLIKEGFFGDMADRFKKGYQKGLDWWKNKPAGGGAAGGGGTPAAAPSAPADPATATPAATTPAAPAVPAAAAAPAAPAPATADGTSDIVLPHAMLIKGYLQKSLPASLKYIMSGMADPERKAIMTQAMAYVNNLPNVASKVIAEELTPDQQKQQQDLKAKLQAKHAGNPTLVSGKMKTLEDDLKSLVRRQITKDNIKDKLFYSIPKNQQNSKQALQYIKSLQQQPDKHLAAFLESTDLVIKNVIALIQKGVSQSSANAPQKTVPTPTVPKQAATPPPPPADALNENRINRMRLMAGIIKK